MFAASTAPVSLGPAQDRRASDEDHVTGPVTDCNVSSTGSCIARRFAFLLASARQESVMHALASLAGQPAESAKVAVVAAAIAVVAFWKVLLRLLIAVIAIALVALVGAGLVLLLQR